MNINRTKYAVVLIIALLAWSCGGGGGGTPSPFPGGAEHTQEIICAPGTDAVISLVSGAKATFFAGTFDVATTIIFSDTIVGIEREAQTYPADTTGPISYMTINNPASQDNQFHKDVNVVFNLRITGGNDGTKYWVYRYNDETLKWERWGTTYATISDGGQLATATLPTNGVSYYIGSVALFAGHTVEGGGLPGDASAVITGTVTNSADDTPVVGVDVMLYLIDASIPFAHDFINGVADPDNPNNHNMVLTGADGRYTIQFGSSDISPGMVYLIRIGQRTAGWVETESSTFTVDEGVNPDKNFVITPST
jgi:hypothetical protein